MSTNLDKQRFEGRLVHKFKELRLQKLPRLSQVGQVKVTWQELVRVEPRLGLLYRKARAFRGTPGFCANEVWYANPGLKGELVALVGWDAAIPLLRTEAAYDVAYRTVYSALPDCQHDGPIC